MRTRLFLMMLFLFPARLFAASTGTINLHMPQGSAAGTGNGDYVSDATALNTFYRYFIEVPPGLARLTVELFDADIGRGGAGEDDAGRDRDRGGGFTSTATYTLIRPDGTTAATLGPCNTTTCTDNAWSTLLNSNTAQNTAAGHWELRIDMAGGNDINAVGIRAHDGTAGAGGTELNIYADSMLSLGVNPDPGANSRTYTLYPWVTSGCTCSENDFDRDTNNGDTGSVTYTSRGGTFTQTFTSATLSGDNAWNRDTVPTWMPSRDKSTDYGVWTFSDTLNTYDNGATNGNYETFYIGNYLAAANPPTANPILSGVNPAAFRLYLPTDAGVAPVKPYLEQYLTQNRNFSGPNPPQVGVQTTFTVTIFVVNPTAFALTFNASNLVTANIPGGQVLYGGNPGLSQGSIVSQPAVAGSGNLTWNPGTVAAGATIKLSYDVRVIPTSAAAISVTATPASGNGTRAQFIDETGNTTQTRARYTMGGVCDLTVVAGTLTEASVSSFSLDVRGGATTVDWSTASEAGTVGFNVYRANGERVNSRLIPASLQPQGGKYEFVDPGNRDPTATYFIEEVTSDGATHRYGPFNQLKGVDREKKQQDQRVARRLAAEGASSGIESNAAKTKAVAVMLGVRETGVVRVPFADIAAVFDSTADAIQKEANKGRLALTSNGASVAWTNDASALYFLGEKTTSIYSNDRVYRLDLDKGVKMAGVAVNGAASTVTSFPATQDIESDVFAATILPLDPASDYWFWEAFISGDPDYGRKTFTVDVPAMASASGATLSVRLQGAFKDTTHRVRVSLNGVPVGDVVTWQSFDAKTGTISLPAAILRDGTNEITVEGVLEGAETLDIFYVDGFTLDYQKLAQPSGGQIEVRRTGSVGAGPFTAMPMILDITNRKLPTVLQGAAFSGGTASLVTPPTTQNLFFAQTFQAPSFLRAVAEAKLKSNTRVDWLIVAPRSMRAAAESLAQLHAREGMATTVVDLEQIYDEFAGGNATPLAIKDYFKFTRSWSRPPSYYVLGGVGTVDYRGIRSAPGPIPPLMTSTPYGLYASDSLFVDFNNDRLPEAAIGRIPVSTSAELSAYVAKLDANARIDSSRSPIVFSADTMDQGLSFRNDSARIEAPLASRPATRIYLDDLGGEAARTALLNAWHVGTPLVSWVGHGGLDLISSSAVLTAYDSPSLQSTGRLPVFIAMTCTINRFENGFVDAMGTALTKESGAGALAVWSASGLSLHSQANDIQRSFMRIAISTADARVGDIIVKSLAAFPGDTSSVYLLLGDPAIKLGLPAEVSNGGGGTPSNE